MSPSTLLIVNPFLPIQHLKLKSWYIKVYLFFKRIKLSVVAMINTKLIIYDCKDIYKILYELNDFLKFDLVKIDNEADLKTSGNFASASSSLSGTTVAFGSATHFASGMYIQTEVGNTDYDKITVTDIGNAAGDADDATGKGDAEADPSIAYGRITLGYKF